MQWKIFMVVATLALAIYGSFLFLHHQQIRQNLAVMPITQILQDDKTLAQAEQYLGVKRVMDKLLEESGNGNIYDCHQDAHYIGRIGYSIEGQKAFVECDSRCHSGCYHGAMESMLRKKGTVDLAANIEAVCGIFNTAFERMECFHGVGHGIMAYTDYDLSKAIELCHTLKNADGSSQCAGGIFMENLVAAVTTSNSPTQHSTSWISQTDPHFPCNEFYNNTEVQRRCYQMQTGWIRHLYHDDFDKVAKECLNATPTMIPICFQSYGRDAAGYVLRNPNKILKLCEKVPDTYYDDCVLGGLYVIIDFWGDELQGQASQMCSLVPANHKINCYRLLAERLNGLFEQTTKGKERRQKICDTFEPAYRSMCDSIN